VPDYNGALNQLKTKTAEAWISPAEIGEKTAKDSGGKVTLVTKQLSPAPTAFAVAKNNPALAEALDKGLDQVIADGTWTRLEQQYYPGRQIPAGFKPGSGSVALPK
jgi:polar amino acid transport system substrate-binding protein